ncbi:hypothetical protein OHT76_38765 [Streptomyces sp. NBC_00287]|uniref:hypothetical protein n=1 Tax=Streptomyces sp. NBC_00287 TaxID=2975702 RepID=UPI002E2D3BE2|nr:hypothetical protein [Streptomyces sp. NBC_00287]
MAALSDADGRSGPTVALTALCVFAVLLGLPARFTTITVPPPPATAEIGVR